MIKRFFKKKAVATTYSWVRINKGLFNGKTLFLPDSWGEKIINGEHESEIIKTMELIVNQDGTFYDIGAHYGWFSIAWLSLNGKYVEAFEPSSYNKGIIRKTVEINEFGKNLNLHAFALGKKSEESELQLYPTDTSRNFISKSKDNNLKTRESIQIKSLDEIYDTLKLKKPDLIKIDVEGYEIEVLKGSKNLLKKLKPTIIIEIHDVTNGLLVADFMSKLGFKMKILGYKGKNQTLPLVLWLPN